MEEVDNIIIHSLRQIGCDIEEDVQSLKHFSTDMVVNATVMCLEVIQPGIELPHSLPPNMAARFRVGANIAQTCHDIGYTGEVGYQTFLYLNVADVRRVLMFLIEKLPKESEKNIVEPAGNLAQLQKAISEKLRSQLSSSWVPSFCLSKGLRWFDDGTFSREGCGLSIPFLPSTLNVQNGGNTDEDIASAWREFYANHLPAITQNPISQLQLLPTIISLNSKSLMTEKSPTNATSNDKKMQILTDIIAKDLKLCPTLKHDKVDTFHDNSHFTNIVKSKPLVVESSNVEPRKELVKPKIAPRPKGLEISAGVEKKRNELNSIERAKEETEVLKQRIEELQSQVNTLVTRSTQIKKEITVEEKVFKESEERLRVKRLTEALVPQAAENVNRFEQIVENNARQVVVIAHHFEKHYRSPSLQKYREAKQRNSNKASESQRQADAVRNLREKVRELSEEVRIKEQLHLQLLAEYEKVTKDVNRSAYTRRILEIIGNIRKQKNEIDKVLNDTKDLQKEINNLGGQLDRSFTVADELIFRDAKKDEVSRRAYKLLATLHSDCSELVHVVEETGATVREIRDLEEQIELESLKNVGANLERISADLKQMKQESAALAVQIKSKP